MLRRRTSDRKVRQLDRPDRDTYRLTQLESQLLELLLADVCMLCVLSSQELIRSMPNSTFRFCYFVNTDNDGVHLCAQGHR